jgi:replicative DNA helicase
LHSVISSLNQQFAFGYFLVEIQSKFLNDFYTIDQNRSNIKAIVSRYYSLDSYTTGNEQGSAVYTHEGPPMTLSSFNCRILDSDKNLATNIGDDSTIFLEIIKAPKEQ